MKILSNKKYYELILKSCKGMFGAVTDDMLLRENALLYEENKQLKDNWNKLKKIVKSQSDFKLKCHNESLWFEVDELLNKMQELEKGDSNE